MAPNHVILFKRFRPDASLPKKEPGNAAYDLVCPDQVVLHPFKPTLVDLGFGTEFPDTLWANVRSRSSSAPRKRVLVVSGVIDSIYRGPWKLCLLYIPEMKERDPNQDWTELLGGDPSVFDHQPLVLEPGDRVAQVVFEFLPETTWQETETLGDSSRGNRGFGENSGL